MQAGEPSLAASGRTQPSLSRASTTCLNSFSRGVPGLCGLPAESGERCEVEDTAAAVALLCARASAVLIDNGGFTGDTGLPLAWKMTATLRKSMRPQSRGGLVRKAR